MKKLKLFIPAFRKEAFQFYIFNLSLRENTKGQLLLKYLYVFGYTIFFALIFLLPFGNFFSPAVDGDTATLAILLILIPITVGLFLSTVLMNGKRRLIDPVFFLAILLFALGTTTSSVLTSNPSLSNTFGAVGVRALSGIGIVLMIAMYYLSGIYIHNRELLRRAFKILIAGIYFYFVLALLNQSLITSAESLTLLIAALGGTFVLTKSSLNQRAFKFCAALFLIVVGFFGLGNSQLNSTPAGFMLIAMLASFVIVLLTFYFAKRNFLKVIFRNSRENLSEIFFQKKLRYMQFLKLFFDWLIILSPVIILVVLLLINNSSPVFFSSVKEQLESNFKAFNQIADFTKNIDGSSLGTFLFGIGAGNISGVNTFVENIIVSQGFLGLASYLFLWTYGVIVVVRLVYSNFKKGGNYAIPTFLLFLLTMISVEGLFFNISLKIVWLWWIAFSFISVKYALKNKVQIARFGDKDFVIADFKVGSRKISRFSKYFLVLLILIAFAYIAMTFKAVVLK